MHAEKLESLATIAVIGAGMAGLACARSLTDAGASCVVVEKSRGVGGRMATRRSGEWQFDHGARFFSARGSDFAATLSEWAASGVAARWRPRGTGGTPALPPGVYVGMPRMSSPVRSLVESVEVITSTRVGTVVAAHPGWRLLDEHGAELGDFGTVLVTAPAPQALPLLSGAPSLAAAAAAVAFEPCWAVMFAFADPLAAPPVIRPEEGSAIAWASREASKPGRPGAEAWVLHASTDWSKRHLEAGPEEIAGQLGAAFAELLGQALPPVAHSSAHRWLYSRPQQPVGLPCLWDPERRLGAAGDWCLGSTVEAAFDSGRALAAAVIAST